MSFDEWDSKWKCEDFKGFRMVEVKGEEVGKRILGDVFNSVEKYAEWVKGKGFMLCSKVKGNKVYKWEVVK